jgi:hypothetical protein
MSLFGAIADGIGSYFGAPSGTGSALAGVAGTALGMIGNENAADTVAQGNRDALAYQEQKDAQARQDLLASKAQATGALAPIVAAGQPARSYLSGQITNDYTKLTPMQQIGLEDLNRTTMNNLSVSGMRGAGYGGQAVLADADRRYLGGAYDTNRARSDAAAGTLNNQGVNATQGTANADLGTGSNIAGINVGLGQAGSNLTQSTAGTNASADLASTRALASGIGSLSGIGSYSDQQKAQDPYANFNATNQARSDVSSGNPIFAKGGVVPPAHMIPRRSALHTIGA